MQNAKILQEMCDKYGFELVASWNRYWVTKNLDADSLYAFSPGIVISQRELDDYTPEQIESMLVEFLMDHSFG